MEIVKEYADSYLGSGISIGGFTIRFYALCILFGMIIAIILGLREAKKMNISTDDIFTGGVWGIILGVLGARIYYVIFEFKTYKNNPLEMFAIWNGGLAIHGGIIVAFVFAFFYCRKKKINILAVLDFVAIGLLIGQICGRWGNFFNQEAHGGETTLEFLRSLRLPDFIIKQMRIEGVYYHPTFYYESMWNLVCLIVLLILRRTKTIRLGDCTGIYLIWYGIGRFWIEGMRTDSLMIGSIKQNQLISIVLIVVGIAYLVFKYVKLKPDYYVYYLDVPFVVGINKDTLKGLEERDIYRLEMQAVEEIKEVEEEKIEEIKKEDEAYEIPEELSKDAPFRKSKYVVDDDDEE